MSSFISAIGFQKTECLYYLGMIFGAKRGWCMIVSVRAGIGCHGVF